MLTFSSCGGGGGDSSSSNTQTGNTGSQSGSQTGNTGNTGSQSDSQSGNTGSQTGNTGGSTDTQTSAYLDVIPDNETEKVALYYKRMSEFADIYNGGNMQLYNLLKNTTNDFSTTNTHELTDAQIKTLYDTMPKLYDNTLEVILYGYNLSRIRKNLTYNVHQNVTYTNKSITTILTGIGIGMGMALIGNAGYSWLHDGAQDRKKKMKEAIDDATPQQLETLNDDLGLKSNNTKAETKDAIDKFGTTETYTKTRNMSFSDTGSDGTKKIHFTEEIDKSINEGGKYALTSCVGASVSATGGQGIDKLASWIAGTAGVVGEATGQAIGILADAIVSYFGKAPLDYVANNSVVSQTSKEGKDTKVPAQTTTPEKSVKYLENIKNGGKETSPEETKKHVNTLINETLKNNGAKQNEDGSIDTKIPTAVFITKLNKGDRVPLVDSDGVDVEIVTDEHKPEIIENVTPRTNTVINIKNEKIETNTGANSNFTVGAVLTEGGLVYSYTVTVTIKNNKKPVKVTIDGEGVALMDTTKTVGINGSISWEAVVAKDDATAIITRLDTGEQRSVLLKGTNSNGGVVDEERLDFKFRLYPVGLQEKPCEPFPFIMYEARGNNIYFAKQSYLYPTPISDDVVIVSPNGPGGLVGTRKNAGKMDTSMIENISWQIHKEYTDKEKNRIVTDQTFSMEQQPANTAKNIPFTATSRTTKNGTVTRNVNCSDKLQLIFMFV